MVNWCTVVAPAIASWCITAWVVCSVLVKPGHSCMRGDNVPRPACVHGPRRPRCPSSCRARPRWAHIQSLVRRLHCRYTAEVLDLVSMEKIGCPCIELCTLQQDRSRAAPATHHRRKWVLAKHDTELTEANTQLLLAMDSEAPKQPTKRKRQPKGKVPASAPKAAAAPVSADDNSSDDYR